MPEAWFPRGRLLGSSVESGDSRSIALTKSNNEIPMVLMRQKIICCERHLTCLKEDECGIYMQSAYRLKVALGTSL